MNRNPAVSPRKSEAETLKLLRRLPKAPKYRAMGFGISHGWERVPENMAYMREENEPPPSV